MDFDFSDEQHMLRETVRRWVEKDYTFESRRKNVTAGGFSPQAWRSLSEIGLLGLRISEDHGGMGMGPIEAMVVMEELGRGIVLEPYLHGAIMAPYLLGFAPARVREQLLPAIVAGEKLVVLAHQERVARYRLNHVTSRAVQAGEAWLLDGAKSVVPAGPFADAFIVPARVSGAANDADGIALFLVQRDSAGVEVRPYLMQDGASAAEVVFSSAAAVLIAEAGDAESSGFALLESAVDRGIAALCADAVGGMESLLSATISYLNTRKQFGVPLASFQALRHRVADMKLQLELGRSMSFLATMKLDSDPRTRRRVLSQAKLQIGRSMRFVGQQSLQLHGGIGLTDEYLVSHYFRHLTVLEMTFGDTLHQLGEVSGRLDETAVLY